MRRNEFDAEADFRETDHADIEQFKRWRGDEADDLRLRPGTAQLGENVRIEQPPCHSVASRTGIGPRCGSMSISSR